MFVIACFTIANMHQSKRLGEIRAILASALELTSTDGGDAATPTRCKGSCTSNGGNYWKTVATLYVDMLVYPVMEETRRVAYKHSTKCVWVHTQRTNAFLYVLRMLICDLEVFKGDGAYYHFFCCYYAFAVTKFPKGVYRSSLVVWIAGDCDEVNEVAIL